MSLLPNGTHVCDRCGADVGNGAVTECVIVSDLVEDTGEVRVLHFCRVGGCAKRVLSKRNLTHYDETRT